MRRSTSTLLTLTMALGLLLAQAGTASANPIAGGGYSSSYVGESVFTEKAAGETAQNTAIFFNEGSVTWVPGVIGLLICMPDKVTCNVTSPNAAYASGWFSSLAYATVTTNVAPGQNAFFLYNFTVPSGTPGGTAVTFNGDVGIIPTGALLRPEGYFQVNTTPPVLGTISISPTSASVPLNGTQQFTATTNLTGTISWTVEGGCGAVTNAGLFVATTTNSASQPCTVTAHAGSIKASASVTVFGPPTSLACAATPSTVTASGGGAASIATVTFTLKDQSGNTVANASSPSISVTNSTPSLATVSPTGAIAPTNGVATVMVTATTTPGQIVVSASATSSITGCNALIQSNAPGNAAGTVSTFVDNPIAADGVSTSTFRTDIVDANGARVADNTTAIDVSRTAGASVCTIESVITGTSGAAGGGSGSATAVNGRVEFLVKSTTTTGTCTITATPRNTSIAASSASLTTQIVGLPTKVVVVANDSPHPAGSSSLTKITVELQDANGARVTGATNTITATLDTNSCTGAGGGNVVIASANPTSASAGRAVFQFTSNGAYTGCGVNFNSSGLASASTTIVFTPGADDHLGCKFSPSAIINDGASVASALVTVKDRVGNDTGSGTYSVNFSRTAGGGFSSLITSNPQTMSAGLAVFQVRSTTSVGTDTYTPSLASGTLPNVVPNGSCEISIQSSV